VNEQAVADAAAAQLLSLGYSLVEREVAAGTRHRPVRVDLVAWGADDSGSLVPVVGVEFRSDDRHDAKALVQLQRCAAAMDTTLNYVFDGQTWLAANNDFTTLTAVSAPVRASVTAGTVTDLQRVETLLDRELWAAANELRSDRLDPDTPVTALVQVLRDVARTATADDRYIVGGAPVTRRDMLVAARRFVTKRLWTGSRSAVSGAHPGIPPALIRLLDIDRAGLLLDPVCGTGSLLAAASEYAAAASLHIDLQGIEINADIAQLATALVQLAGGDATIDVADSLEALPREVDYLVAEPPMGQPGHREFEVEWGLSRDADSVLIERMVRSLRPGGRAVIHTGRRWLWSRPAEPLRRWLLDQYRVVAILGLPAGLYPGVSSNTAVAVIDNGPPLAETFVAELKSNWYDDLVKGGEVYNAFLAHARQR
jgi:SAM-dependent methyltransferase